MVKDSLRLEYNFQSRACTGRVACADDRRFDEIAQITKRACVVSRALAAVPVSLTTQLLPAEAIADRLTAATSI